MARQVVRMELLLPLAAAGKGVLKMVPGDEAKNPEAVERGRKGGKKGGKKRASKMSAARRSEVARNAAQARWSKRPTH